MKSLNISNKFQQDWMTDREKSFWPEVFAPQAETKNEGFNDKRKKTSLHLSPKKFSWRKKCKKDSSLNFVRKKIWLLCLSSSGCDSDFWGKGPGFKPPPGPWLVIFCFIFPLSLFFLLDPCKSNLLHLMLHGLAYF